jgi:hypothetical protein
MKLDALLFLATLASFAEARTLSSKKCKCENTQYVANTDNLSFYGHQLALADKNDKWSKFDCTFASITTDEEQTTANAIARNVLGVVNTNDIVPLPSPFDFMYIGLARPQDVTDATSADADDGEWFWLDGTVYDDSDEYFVGGEPNNFLEGSYGVEETAVAIFGLGYEEDDNSWFDLPPTYLGPALYECCIPEPAEACTEE